MSVELMKKSIVEEKSYQFAKEIIKIYKQLRFDKEYKLSEQLLACGTSIGANVAEALAGQSKKDFISKMSIASKEARETKYWLKLLRDSEILDAYTCAELLSDADELSRILTSIVKTSIENNNSYSQKLIIHTENNYANSKLKTQNSKLLAPAR